MTTRLRDLNNGDAARFVAGCTPLFEGTPEWVVHAWPARPFVDLAALHAALCAVMYTLPPEEQVGLIRAHPDLVGRAARAGTLSAASTREQGAAGLADLTPSEIAAFDRLNAAYREKFGFPFVLCARENKKDAILAGFAARLPQARADEIATALGEIARIAWLRLLDAVQPDEPAP